jgi:(hydroxyamino)benzene mutase
MAVFGQDVTGAPGDGVRHPLDPDPVPSTKALATLVLGVFGLATGIVIGGAVPAIVALVLARQARRDLVAAGGFLTGTRRVRVGVACAWAGIVLAVAATVALAVRGIYVINQGPRPRNYGPDFN